MGIFDYFKKPDINAGVREYRTFRRAMLVDVREPQEYNHSHIPGARNIPLGKIDRATSAIQDKDMPLFVYCYNGARSKKAVAALKKMGYTNVKNIGGAETYSGKLEH